jgi:hypothetical protein
MENENEEKDRKLSAGKKIEKPSDEFLSEDEIEMIREEDSDTTNWQKGESPLDNPVVERSYTERKYVGDTMTPIPEPKDIQAPQQAPQQPSANTGGKQEKQQEEEKRQENKRFATEGLGETKAGSGNPAAETMTEDEKKKYVEQSVDMALHIYEKGWNWVPQWLQISDTKLVARVRAGKCPPDWAVLYDSATGEALTLREAIHEGNRKIADACQTDPKWIAAVRPVAIDEFTRRNWVVTPQNNLLIMLAMDAGEKIQKLAANVMAMKQIMAGLDKEFEEKKKSGLISLRDDYNARLYGYTPPQEEAVKAVKPEEEAVKPQEEAVKPKEHKESEPVFEVPLD